MVTRAKSWRSQALLGITVLGLFIFSAASVASALTGDAYYERPSSGYEGTYEWRGVCAYTYVYDWSVQSSSGIHVSSVYIRHPLLPDNLRHMEIGVAKDRSRQVSPFVFKQWCDSSWDWNAIQGPFKISDVSPWTNQKLLIRNMTMGNPDSTWERWIMSWNDVIFFDQLHPLTYGQAWESAEVLYVGLDDNRAHWYTSKRTSKPASWTNWTASRVALNQDPTHNFFKINETEWYNVHP